MKTIIEAGHYYEIVGPTVESLRCWEIGKQLAAESDSAELALLVDDYHAAQDYFGEQDAVLEPGAAQKAILRMKDEADYVFSEAELALTASEELEKIIQLGMAKTRKGIVSVAGVRLGQIQEGVKAFEPTCVFLDFLFLRIKAAIAPCQKVVLPEIFLPQQKQLETVVGRLSIPGLVSYKTVFCSAGSEEKELVYDF